jgi:hypothetical protein
MPGSEGQELERGGMGWVALGSNAGRSTRSSTRARTLDTIFGAHAVWAAATGTTALVWPQMFEIFMNFEDAHGCNRLTRQAQV